MRKKTKFLKILLMILLLTGCRGNGTYAEPIAERITASKEMEKPSESFTFEEPFHDRYAYEHLNDSEKIWYEEINQVLAVRSDTPVKLSKEGFRQGLTTEDVDRIYQCVMIDHPEYFYVEGYEYTQYSAWGEVVGIEVCGTYNGSFAECAAKREQIREAETEILQGLPADADDYEKIKYVYETIIEQTDYRMDAADNQNIYSVFAGHASVCQGYAKAAQYLLNHMGISCTIIFGEVENGEGHAFNLVQADGDYYYLDTTWGDVSYMAQKPGQETRTPKINYDYLCITTEQLLRTHRLKHLLEVPLCEATRANYYVREGCFFTAFEEEQIQKVFEDALVKSKDFITLKCRDQAAFECLCQELIKAQKVFSYMDTSYETISYIVSEQQLSLTFWVTK